MRIIASGRKTSRTTQLIELCHEAEQRGEASYIVCRSTIACMQVFQRAEEMGQPVAMPISYNEFLEVRYAGIHIKNFFIDDAELLLAMLAPGVNIAAITLLKGDDDGDGS